MTAGQSLADGAAGIALLHLETGSWQAACQLLRDAVAGGATIAGGASLYYGAPALAYVLTASGHPSLHRARATAVAGAAQVTRNRLEAAHRRIDHAERPPYAEFDLIRGLTGLGVALRRIGDLDLLRDVLNYLVRLTESLRGLPGWWCPHGPRRDQPGPAGGHSNHGIAHGISGPLALLTLALRDGIKVEGHIDAINRICHWLDQWEQLSHDGAWWPEIVTLDDLDRGATHQTRPLRPSWCYGTPGIARAIQLTALALGDTGRQHKAETAFVNCVNDPQQVNRIIDRSLCHGTSGLLTTARRIAEEALTPIPVQNILRLHRQASVPAGEPPGFLDGTAGADIALAGTTTAWDACLLLC